MSWKTFQKNYIYRKEADLGLDWSRMQTPAKFFATMQPKMEKAFQAMGELEGGAIANPDEQRMVGHYWLRNPDLAPTADLKRQIKSCRKQIAAFVEKVHRGEIGPQPGKLEKTLRQGPTKPESSPGKKASRFTDVLVIGIGGSALGPQFIAHALGRGSADRMRMHFLDNTDPDGFDRMFRHLGSRLKQTLIVVISKSGGTPETRNGMLEAKAAWEAVGLNFAEHAVAITGTNSALDRYARKSKWLARFPMWDWVGGRTSVTSAVGLLPAALQGIDIDAFLDGAAQMDAITRERSCERNPAAILALMWYHATGGRGKRDMVILPYKDRLELFSKYLQQLIMESLGKELDLDGNRVHQGIAVYGNKGSTDQHAYVQQLRDGIPNFFVTFIEVLRDREGEPLCVDGSATSGDFLHAFLLGTQKALSESGRPSLTITITDVVPYTVGALIALYERAVGYYASLININAYHQPGVEAGKKAAAAILDMKARIVDHMRAHNDTAFDASMLANAIGLEQETETVFKILNRLASNPESHVMRDQSKSDDPLLARFKIK